MSESRRIRVLMLAESVTLAHLARPLALAMQLDPARYDIVLARPPRYKQFAKPGHWKCVDLIGLDPLIFSKALAAGTPVISKTQLRVQVAEDLRILNEIQPDIVVGDFRLSSSISARVAGIPYVNITNAYWTQYFDSPFPMPVLPISRILPVWLASGIFRIARPAAFMVHARPFEQVRREYGQPTLGYDLRRAYSDADHLLIADVPGLFPMHGETTAYSFIGPLTWSPAMPAPASIQSKQKKPIVYVSLGSSGPDGALAMVLDALQREDIEIYASTAGGTAPQNLPANVFAAPYMPGATLSARANLVVCNGGSLAVQQSLLSGVPVLAVATNMDQFLNMNPIERAGAGLTLRSDRLSKMVIRNAAMSLLQSTSALLAAKHLQQQFQALNSPGECFDLVASKMLISRKVR